jgi:hypothetical protein
VEFLERKKNKKKRKKVEIHNNTVFLFLQIDYNVFEKSENAAITCFFVVAPSSLKSLFSVVFFFDHHRHAD